VKTLKDAISLIYNLYAIGIFLILMLLIFPFVLLASMFGRVTGGNLIYKICVFWGDVWFFLIAIRPRNIYEYAYQHKPAHILVCNHISYLDTPMLVKTFRYPLRALGKEEMMRIPVFGYIYKYAVVTVNRGSREDRTRSIQKMKSVLNKGISILVFPEGTFNETTNPLKDFYDGAFRVAIDTQTSIRPVIFPDTHDRMNHTKLLSLNPGKCRAVFLQEIPVQGLTQEDLPALKEQVYQLMWNKLIEYKASWIEPGCMQK
jgi:1-acyl-sn-glycerol-3-phosphate acyltransferase